MSPFYSLPIIVLAMLVSSNKVAADTNEVATLRQQLTAMAEQLDQIHETYGGQIEVLEARLQALESTPVLSSPGGRSGNMKIGLSGLIAGGISNTTNEALASLQGGAHDPNQFGFSVQTSS